MHLARCEVLPTACAVNLRFSAVVIHLVASQRSRLEVETAADDGVGHVVLRRLLHRVGEELAHTSRQAPELDLPDDVVGGDRIAVGRCGGGGTHHAQEEVLEHDEEVEHGARDEAINVLFDAREGHGDALGMDRTLPLHVVSVDGCEVDGHHAAVRQPGVVDQVLLLGSHRAVALLVAAAIAAELQLAHVGVDPQHTLERSSGELQLAKELMEQPRQHVGCDIAHVLRDEVGIGLEIAVGGHFCDPFRSMDNSHSIIA